MILCRYYQCAQIDVVEKPILFPAPPFISIDLSPFQINVIVGSVFCERWALRHIDVSAKIAFINGTRAVKKASLAGCLKRPSIVTVHHICRAALMSLSPSHTGDTEEGIDQIKINFSLPRYCIVLSLFFPLSRRLRPSSLRRPHTFRHSLFGISVCSFLSFYRPSFEIFV